jgi:transcriptional regulator GlxA family with amidase domain
MSIEEENKRASSETLISTDSQPGLLDERKTTDPRVRIAIDFMLANLHRKISLIDLGRKVNLSAAHVSRLFSIETGLSPSEYLIRLRMENARRLLATSLLSIKEIMALSGYNNRGHFVQHFKRYFMRTPSDYRRSLSS